jgi:dipeptidyl aminopeptidase/acylaminoacyl peptidase
MTSGATQTPPLATSVPDVHPTDTQTPVQIPTVESGITAYLPVKGNADKIAFIHEQEIWMVNLDGSELTQLTDDEQPKSSLRWFTDTQGVIYLSGSCAILIDINTSETNPLICFEGADRLETFEIAPDSSQVAISLDRQLYVLPFDQDKLNTAKSSDDLIAMANCTTFAPYKSNVTVKSALWSADGNHLAILRQGNDTGQLVDMIHIIDLSNCVSPIPLLDEFPATRFEMEDYVENPIIQNFAWDGKDLFALTSFRRNDGFGDLWIYSYDLHRGFLANPVEGKCCYRDPVFSPDGNYLAFVFQDAKTAPKGPARLYYIPYDAIDTSLVYPPLSLPGDFLSDPRTKPQPALRPVP